MIRRFNHRPFLAAFLLAHLALTIPLVINAAGWRHLISSSWFWQLDSGIEGTSANIYSGYLWGFVALLALAQIARSGPEVKPRWLMVVGWVSFGGFAALIAFEELASVKDTLGVLAASARLAALKISDLPQSARWLAVVAPIAVPMAAAAWVTYSSQRKQPGLRMLTLLAIVMAMTAAIRDGFNASYGTTTVWEELIEEGSELISGAILFVVLVEMLLRRSYSPSAGTAAQRLRSRIVGASVPAAFILASIPALFAQFEWEVRGWARPHFYSGPVSVVSQRFAGGVDFLNRIELWAYLTEPGAPEAPIYMRLLRDGSADPVREARANVRWRDPRPMSFSFEPLPDSATGYFELEVGLLPGPTTYLNLGANGGDPNPHGELIVNGEPTGFASDLALGTFATARGGRIVQDLLTRDPNRLILVFDVAIVAFFWFFAVFAAWSGIYGTKPRFWRTTVRAWAQPSILAVGAAATIMAVLVTIISGM